MLRWCSNRSLLKLLCCYVSFASTGLSIRKTRYIETFVYVPSLRDEHLLMYRSNRRKCPEKELYKSCQTNGWMKTWLVAEMKLNIWLQPQLVVFYSASICSPIFKQWSVRTCEWQFQHRFYHHGRIHSVLSPKEFIFPMRVKWGLICIKHIGQWLFRSSPQMWTRRAA